MYTIVLEGIPFIAHLQYMPLILFGFYPCNSFSSMKLLLPKKEKNKLNRKHGVEIETWIIPNGAIYNTIKTLSYMWLQNQCSMFFFLSTYWSLLFSVFLTHSFHRWCIVLNIHYLVICIVLWCQYNTFLIHNSSTRRLLLFFSCSSVLWP